MKHHLIAHHLIEHHYCPQDFAFSNNVASNAGDFTGSMRLKTTIHITILSEEPYGPILIT